MSIHVNRLLYRPLVIRLELDSLLVARMRVCGMAPQSLTVLGKPLRIVPCKGGVAFDRVTYHTSYDLTAELLYRAGLCDETAALCGGEHTASGRWRMDRAAFFRAAAAIVRLYRGQLWPTEQDD
jgi:hypothetical protein